MALYNEAKELYTKAWGSEEEEEGREGRLEDTHVIVANKCLVCFSDWHPKLLGMPSNPLKDFPAMLQRFRVWGVVKSV
jgi:hypothetical protein